MAGPRDMMLNGWERGGEVERSERGRGKKRDLSAQPQPI